MGRERSALCAANPVHGLGLLVAISGIGVRLDSGRPGVVLSMFSERGGRMIGIKWAGVPFTPMHHHDGRMFRSPGLFCLVRRLSPTERLLLFAGHAECLGAAANPAHPMWTDALQLGMNEINLNLVVMERLDRLQLLSRIIRHCQPLLNVLAEQRPGSEAAWDGERSAAKA